LLMARSMMSRFAANDFNPVEIEGELVHPMLRLIPSAGDRVRLAFISAASPRVQGLAVRLRRPEIKGEKGYAGLLRLENIESPAVALWMDTAPPEVEIECVRIDEGGEVRISNRWRLEDGREDEWFGNYGILIEEIDKDSFVLRCSDGIGEQPSFDDLVVSVELVRAERA
jgi:hypothetical protein